MPLRDLVVSYAGPSEDLVERMIGPYVRYDTTEHAVIMLPAARTLGVRARVLLYLVALHGWPFVKPRNTPDTHATAAQIAAHLKVEVTALEALLAELHDRGLVTLRRGRFEVPATRLAAVERVLSDAERPAAVRRSAGGNDAAVVSRVGPPHPAAALADAETTAHADEAPTPLTRLRRLVREGWFRQPRTARDALHELQQRGAPYRASDLTRQLQILTKRGELHRYKQRPREGLRAVWIYVQD